MNHMKQRWALAERIANALGVSKQEGFTLIPILTERGLLDRVLNGEPEALQAAGKLEWFGKTNVTLEGKAQAIKIMLWAIGKCGTVEAARAAFEKAAKLLSDNDDEPKQEGSTKSVP